MSQTAEHRRLAEAEGAPRTTCSTRTPGTNGVPTCPSGPGERSARTTAPAATPGTTSRTTTPGRGRTGGTRTAWPACPTSATTCASLGAVERHRSDPQGADVRPDRAAGQPRRGRQGVLVVSRRPAEPRVVALALPLPADRVPLSASCVEENARRGRGRTRVRAARHRRVRRRPLLGRSRSPMPRRHRPTMLRADHHREPRTRRGRACRCCRRCGSATPGESSATSRRTLAASTATASPSNIRDWPATAWMPTPARTAPRQRRCSATTRRTRPTLFGVDAGHARIPKDGINDHVVSGAATVNPDRTRHQGRLVVPAHRPGATDGRAAAPAAPAATRTTGSTRRRRHGRFVRRGRGAGEREADEFYAAHRPGGHRCGAHAGAPAVVRRAGLEQADLPVPGEPVAGRRPGQPAAAGRAPQPAATPAGGTWTPSTSWRCPTPGSTRGSPPGTSRSTPITWAHLDPAFAKYQLLVLLREWFQHPNGALPAYEWSFDDVNPPVHALAAHPGVRHRRRHGPRLPETGVPQAAAELHLVAEPAGPRRQQPVRRRIPGPGQHQPDRPLPPAARASASIRPTAPPGWPTTRSPC